jgi:TolB protein
MIDDEPQSGPYQYDFDEPERHSRARSCLFLTITVVLILSLAGSSILAYFALARPSRSASDDSGAPLTIEINSQPTAAPATVAALSGAGVAGAGEAAIEPALLGVNRIAIVNGHGQVETMTPDGQERRRLTLPDNELFFQFPAWSPDDQYLAVVGSGFNGGAIYILEDADQAGELGDSLVYFSADKQPFYLFWSPDSRNLGFLANHTRNTVSLNVVAGDGQDESRLLATGSPFYWDWANNGRQLLIHSGSNQSGGIALIDLNGEEQTGNLALPGNFQAPDIGRDGRYWAFAEEAAGGLSALVVVDTASGERQSYAEAGSLALSWSPAQDLIAFTDGASAQHPWGPLYLLDVTTGEVRMLTDQTVLAFFWSPDGRSIAFITLGQNNSSRDVYAGSPGKSSHLSRVRAVPVQQFGEAPLMLSVIDVATGQGLRLLNFAPTRAYFTQFLPFFDQYALSHRIWSPDGSSLVLPVVEEDGEVILVVPIEGGRPFRLAEGEIAFWSHR